MYYEPCASACGTPNYYEKDLDIEMKLTKKKYSDKEVRMLLDYQAKKMQDHFRSWTEKEERNRNEYRQDESYWKLRDEIYDSIHKLSERIEKLEPKKEDKKVLKD